MKNDLTVIEALGLAIRGEEEAASFYGRIAKALKNNIVKYKYESLAQEEGRHRKMLVEVYCRLTGDKTSPPPIMGKPETAEGGYVPVSVLDLEEVLQLAISREQEANRFYTKAAVDTSDMASQRMFQYLADMEKGHELMLTKELEAYRRDRDWYVNNPDIQLV